MQASKLVMTGALDDHSLVAACRAGQTEAFGVLVRRYQDRLYPTVLRLTGRPEDAQDVLQDAFVQAFQKLDQFQGDSAFYTWLYRIAINRALSGKRSRNHGARSTLHSSHRSDPGPELADESPDSDPVAVAERSEREALVEAALDKLGPEHRAVIILKDFDGCRYEEISALLKIPIGTVRSRLHRARCELRELLANLVSSDRTDKPRVGDAGRIVEA